MGGWLQSREILWGLIRNPHNAEDPNLVPAYKVFIYTVESRAVGYLVAERIKEPNWYVSGRAAIDASGMDPGEDVMVGIHSHKGKQERIHTDDIDCFMGVDRIWVATDYRRQGIATKLIDAAREHFIPGLYIDKQNVAWSKTTNIGDKFALSYLGTEKGA